MGWYECKYKLENRFLSAAPPYGSKVDTSSLLERDPRAAFLGHNSPLRGVLQRALMHTTQREACPGVRKEFPETARRAQTETLWFLSMSPVRRCVHQRH